jgi:hypothetical protein
VFEGEDDERHLIERIVGPLGLRVDGSSPWVDARLPSGSRVHAIIPPLSLCGLAGSHDRTLEGVFDAHERAVFCSASSPPRHRCDARIWAEIEWHQAESVHETSLVDERVDGTRRAEVASRSGALPHAGSTAPRCWPSRGGTTGVRAMGGADVEFVTRPPARGRSHHDVRGAGAPADPGPFLIACTAEPNSPHRM